MSFLNFPNRPTVMFDVTDINHRRWLGEFTRTRSWANCPVKFYNIGAGNNVAQMQLRLLNYYTNREFGEA